MTEYLFRNTRRFHTKTGRREKNKKEIGAEPVPRGGSSKGGKAPSQWEAPLYSKESAGTEGELPRAGGESRQNREKAAQRVTAIPSPRRKLAREGQAWLLDSGSRG